MTAGRELPQPNLRLFLACLKNRLIDHYNEINRKDIEAGEAVSIEDPISAHLSPYKMKSNCCYCFR